MFGINQSASHDELDFPNYHSVSGGSKEQGAEAGAETLPCQGHTDKIWDWKRQLLRVSSQSHRAIFLLGASWWSWALACLLPDLCPTETNLVVAV